MGLLNMPTDIWQKVFTQWLRIRDQHFVERAAGRILMRIPVISVHLEESFDAWGCTMEHTTFRLESETLITAAKNTLQYRLENSKATLLVDQLEGLFRWSADRTKSIKLSGVTGDNNMRVVLTSVSRYCSKLDALNFVLCTPTAREMFNILQNTQDTLRTLLLRTQVRSAAEIYYGKGCALSKLEVLRVSLAKYPHGLYTGVASLLYKCPNLSALSIRGGDSISLGQAMADTLVQLQRLELFRVDGVTDEHMLQIFTHCSTINFLDVWKCEQISSHCLEAAVQTLPLLHTLVSDAIDDALLMRLAVIRAPALRTLYAGVQSGVSCAAIRTITDAYPQLTQLGMFNITHSSVDDIHTMFEHCAALRQLDLSADDRIIMNAALESVALYCSQLQSLNLQHCGACDRSVLSSVWSSCKQLRKLVATSQFLYPVPYPTDDRGWSITNAFTAFAQWIPTVDNIRHHSN